MVVGWDDAALFAAQAALSIGGGMMGNRGDKETKQQRTSRKTADELIASIKGDGPYSGLFNTSEEDFKKFYADPAMSRFKNQVAPQIQQQYIASGQQRGTGMEDSLQRAGVDLNQMLNEQYMQYKGAGQDRMAQVLGNITGMGAGAPQRMTGMESLGQSAAGFAQGDAFGNFIKNASQPLPGLSQNVDQSGQVSMPIGTPQGFAPDWRNMPLGDPNWRNNQW